MYHKRGLWAIKAKNGGVFPRHDPKPKAAAPAEKPPKFYPADDVKKPLVNKRKPKPTKLRYWFSSFHLLLYFSSVLSLLFVFEFSNGVENLILFNEFISLVLVSYLDFSTFFIFYMYMLFICGG